MGMNNYNDIRNLILDIIDYNQAFIMLIGCPASGKSTFAKTLKSDRNELIIINPDDIREELNGDRYDQRNNYEVFSKTYERIDNSISSGKSVVYDATNTITKFREKALHAANKKDILLVGVLFDTTLTGCFTRNTTKPVPVNCSIIEKMYINTKIKKPSFNEGFDILLKINIDE